ncbi:hypothetical protein [Brevundimonas diminuta]|uniref:hypothetical protein n=1 Tax=Brevundimonas diminuta TaxID=293 RepID=UPI003209CA0A
MMGVRATSLIALALVAGLSACSFKPMDPVGPETASARLERLDRQREEESNRLAYCQRMSRDDPRFSRDGCDRRISG